MNNLEDIKKKTKPKRKLFKNIVLAFLIGGGICLFAQFIFYIFNDLIMVNKEISNLITVAIMIVLGSLLTGFGLYDKIGQIGGAGTIVPITGFANSMTSSALDSKSEGLILGIIVNMFKLAGSVIVTGVICSIILSIIRYIIGW